MGARAKLAVLAMLVVAVGFGRWTALERTPTADAPPQAAAATPEPVPVPADVPAEQVVDNGSEQLNSTPLSQGKPDGVPGMAPYSGFGRDVEYVMPEDTEPVIFRQDWSEGLTAEQVALYADGLVRSGMEDLGLCKPGYTCHATIRYRVDEQNRSDYPHAIWIQVTFTTRTRHEELYWYYEGNQTRVWVMTDGTWRYDGVVEDLPERERITQWKLMACSFIKN